MDRFPGGKKTGSVLFPRSDHGDVLDCTGMGMEEPAKPNLLRTEADKTWLFGTPKAGEGRAEEPKLRLSFALRARRRPVYLLSIKDASLSMVRSSSQRWRTWRWRNQYESAFLQSSVIGAGTDDELLKEFSKFILCLARC